MKTISPALQDHLAQTVTTLATCWQIVRTDGETFSFTTFDADLTIGEVVYSSTTGFNRSAISTGSRGSVDNLEVSGFLASTGIDQQDLKNGLFSYASVFVFMVNWADLTMGILKLRHGWLGEAVATPSGVFQAELRGLTQALVQEFGNFFSPLCRADFGDNLCKIPVLPPTWAADTEYGLNTYVKALTQSTDALKMAIFQASGNASSGGTEPAWNTAIGATTTDGIQVWTSMPYFRGIGTVLSVGSPSNQQFTASMPALPGVNSVSTTQAIIAITNNISAGTTMEISDGINTVTFFTEFDLRGSGDKGGDDAFHILYGLIIGNITVGSVYFPPTVLDFSVTVSVTGNTFVITNNSGQQGSIIKTGDYLGGFVVSGFANSQVNTSTIEWISGSNEGVATEMKTLDSDTGLVNLWLSLNYPVQIGDRFYFDSGCDKTRTTCYTRYNNILNNRSEPDMPGMDAILSYPDI